MINSQLSYAIPVWGGFDSHDSLQDIFLLQKRALRNLFSIKKTSMHVRGHTKKVFSQYNILTGGQWCSGVALGPESKD